MTTARGVHHGYQEYLELLDMSSVKLEYCDGEIYAMPSLAAVLLISHRHRQVSIVERTSDGWAQREVRAGEFVVVESLSLSISVDELYAGIDLERASAG